jgi:Carboxypeptidase regulatory-like domain
MRRPIARSALTLACLLAFPDLILAQASIAGTVKDVSGAVLPSVTVAASSDALIEGTRTALTDGTGQYSIADLRPGLYTVTFTRAGFNTVKRDGIELEGQFAATVNASLEVGAIEQTVVVTGESPIVDTRSTTKQRILNHDLIDRLPTGRNLYNVAVLIPGINQTGTFGNQDVGGALGDQMFNLSIHGSRGGDQRVTQNGALFSTFVAQGQSSGATINIAAVQDVSIDTSGASAELATGGVRINITPRDGGNRYSVSMFASTATGGMSDGNLTDRLLGRGLTTINTIRSVWDLNPSAGGPIRRDRVWFFGSFRYNGTDNYAGGALNNRNASLPSSDPKSWVLDPDLDSRVSNRATWIDAQGRVTLQINARNKAAIGLDEQSRCDCPHSPASANTFPDATFLGQIPTQRAITADWSSPMTNRLLVDASVVARLEANGANPLKGATAGRVAAIDLTTGAPRNYRSAPQFLHNRTTMNSVRGAVSYITGAHSFKVGFNHASGLQDLFQAAGYNVMLNTIAGVFQPVSLVQRALDFSTKTRIDHDFGLFVQERWTLRGATLNLGLRYDYFGSSFPAQTVGPTALAPNRNFTSVETPNNSWKDITPKLGVSYDLFGTGKTAVKATANKYLAGQGFSGLVVSPHPLNRLVTITLGGRPWTDANGNFIPDCALSNPAAQDLRASGGDFCGAIDPNFGTNNLTPAANIDPEIFGGWGHRAYNWEVSAGVQQRIREGTSVEVGYFRRVYGNFVVTDNLALTAEDFDRYSVSVPNDPRLPNAGQTIAGFNDVKPAKLIESITAANNRQTFSDRIGRQTEHWNGFDATLSIRVRGRLLQGGVSSGRTAIDTCEVVAKAPEVPLPNIGAAPLLPPGLGVPYCRQRTKLLTQMKALGVYPLSRFGVQVSGAYQSIPGPQVAAIYNALSTVTTLGRLYAGGTPATTKQIQLIAPGTRYGERLHQIDLRFTKLVRAKGSRTAISVDVYNVTNADTVLT